MATTQASGQAPQPPAQPGASPKPQAAEASAPPQTDFLLKEVKQGPSPAAVNDPPGFKARLGEVYGKWKESERRAEAAEAELARVRGSHQNGARAEDFDLSMEVARLQSTFAAAKDDPAKQFEVMTKLTDLKAEEKLTRLRQVESEQIQAIQVEQARSAYATEARRLFGISEENPQNELRARAEQIFNADRFLQASPRGEFDAMLQAAAELGVGMVKSQEPHRASPQISTTSHRAVESSGGNRAQEFESAFTQANRNRDAAMEEYMLKHKPPTRLGPVARR